MKSLRAKGIILRRTNFGEADRILKILTDNEGVVSAIARGVRKEKSKLAGGIELFAVCDLNFHIGKGSLATLTGARIETFFGDILADYDRLQFGYDILKTVGKTVDAVGENEFYNLTVESLSALNDLQIPLDIIKLWFHLHHANLLGAGINTATDSSGMKLVEDARYDFDTDANTFVFSESGEFDTNHLKFLRVLAQNTPTVVASIKNAEQLAADCLRLISQ